MVGSWDFSAVSVNEIAVLSGVIGLVCADNVLVVF